MATSSSDGGSALTPDDIARKSFSMARKGFDPIEVQGFLLSVSAELRAARTDMLDLERELRAAQEDAERNRNIDPARLTALLGEETARVLDAARSVAEETQAKAERQATQLLTEASEEASRLRREAAEVLERRTAEAAAEVEAIRREGDDLRAQAQDAAAAEVERGRQEGRDMVAEAQRVRERMLSDLARRRKQFRQQIERLQAGRDRLMAAYDVVRETLDVATDELQVALPEARLAAEAAALRAGDELEPTADQLEREAAGLPDVAPDATAVDPGIDGEGGPADAEPDAAPAEPGAPVAASEPDEPEPAADDDDAAPGDAEPEAEVPRARSDSSVEGRHSSSVKVIPAEDEAPSAAEPTDTTETNGDAAPDTEAVEAVESESESAEGSKTTEVSGLFARIREETLEAGPDGVTITETETDIEIVEEIVVDEAEVAELARLARDVQTAALADDTKAADGAEDEPEAEPSDPDHQLIARRDAALIETERALSRRIKRELSDEQNELLDTVRRQKGAPTAEAALPDDEIHRKRYRDAALPQLVAAATTGAELVDAGRRSSKIGSDRGAPLADQLAAELVEPLRDRLERCFGETEGDSDELAERLRACYREWKGQRVDELVSRFTLSAANQGLIDALPKGTLVHWVVDDGSTPSPDCDDNALAGDIPKGEAFPTGHVAPPIATHCRCLVAPKAD